MLLRYVFFSILRSFSHAASAFQCGYWLFYFISCTVYLYLYPGSPFSGKCTSIIEYHAGHVNTPRISVSGNCLMWGIFDYDSFGFCRQWTSNRMSCYRIRHPGTFLVMPSVGAHIIQRSFHGYASLTSKMARVERMNILSHPSILEDLRRLLQSSLIGLKARLSGVLMGQLMMRHAFLPFLPSIVLNPRTVQGAGQEHAKSNTIITLNVAVNVISLPTVSETTHT